MQLIFVKETEQEIQHYLKIWINYFTRLRALYCSCSHQTPHRCTGIHMPLVSLLSKD